jgi:hypothetical protein
MLFDGVEDTSAAVLAACGWPDELEGETMLGAPARGQPRSKLSGEVALLPSAEGARHRFLWVV